MPGDERVASEDLKTSTARASRRLIHTLPSNGSSSTAKAAAADDSASNAQGDAAQSSSRTDSANEPDEIAAGSKSEPVIDPHLATALPPTDVATSSSVLVGDPSITPGPGGSQSTTPSTIGNPAAAVVALSVVQTGLSKSAEALNEPKVAVVDSYPLAGVAGGTAISKDGKYVYVASGNTVNVVNTSTDKVTTISVPSGATDVAVGGNYVVAVSPISGGTGGVVTVINADTKKVVNTFTVPVGNSLYDVELSGDGRTAYVFSHNGVMGVVDTKTGTVTKTVAVGAYLNQARSVAIYGNTIYIARDDSPNGNSLSVVNASTGAVTEIPLRGSSRAVTVSADGKTVYVATSSSLLHTDNAIAIIDAATNTIVKTIEGTDDTDPYQGSFDVAASADGKYIYSITRAYTGTGRVTVIDAKTYAIVDQIPLAGNPSEVAMNSKGRYFYVAVTPAGGSTSTLFAIDTLVGGEHTNPIDALLSAISISNEVTKWIDNLSKTWNLGEVLRGTAFVKGVWDVLDGIKAGDPLKILSGVADIGTSLLKGPPALILETAKLVISIVLPLSDEDSEKFFEFRVRCMFHKGSGSLTPGEAQQLVDRYTGPASIVNIPADYTRYNIGGWFGHPSC